MQKHSKITIRVILLLVLTIVLLGLLFLVVQKHSERSGLPSAKALPDFGSIQDVSEKKQAFFSYLRPFVEFENKHIREIRTRIKQLSESTPLNKKQEEWLLGLAKDYRLEISAPMDQKDFERLLGRVDILPASLVLSQAAIESGWGSSRFAREGYNFFGQWCFSKGCGMVPSSRNAGANHEVRIFDSTHDAMSAYFHNLNSHPVYKNLRAQRAEARKADMPPHGCKLALGLEKYSELGKVYVNKVRQMIRINDLSPFDEAACKDLPIPDDTSLAKAQGTTPPKVSGASKNKNTSGNDQNTGSL